MVPVKWLSLQNSSISVFTYTKFTYNRLDLSFSIPGGVLLIYKVPRVCQHLGCVFHQKRNRKGMFYKRVKFSALTRLISGGFKSRNGTPAYKNKGRAPPAGPGCLTYMQGHLILIFLWSYIRWSLLKSREICISLIIHKNINSNHLWAQPRGTKLKLQASCSLPWNKWKVARDW